MELWVLFALLSAVSAGVYSFLLKISAENNNNPTITILYSNIVSTILLIIFSIIFKIDLFTTVIYAMLFGAINMFTYYFGVISRIYSLKHIDATIYFPIYKTLGPILVLLASLFLFNEILTLKEFCGIILGLIVPLLLLSKDENTRQKNLKTGIILLLIGTVLTSFSASISKYYVNSGSSLMGYLFFSALTGILIGGMDFNFNKKARIKKKFSNKYIHKLGIPLGVSKISTSVFFLLALEGNLAIVFTLNSFSILITIILSVLIYKEHFDLKKGIAVALSIVAILFFI
jgi:transporter family protein